MQNANIKVDVRTGEFYKVFADAVISAKCDS